MRYSYISEAKSDNITNNFHNTLAPQSSPSPPLIRITCKSTLQAGGELKKQSCYRATSQDKTLIPSKLVIRLVKFSAGKGLPFLLGYDENTYHEI